IALFHLILHSSLCGVCNLAMIEKRGAVDFLAKFNPDDLATAVKKCDHCE
ncbi:chemotaxis protein CheW, partial [Pseudoalteromonas sp. S409]